MESVVVFSEKLKGALVSAAPVLLPSILNCTLVVLADTFVKTLIVPETVAPDAGDVIETDGGEEVWGGVALVEPTHPAQSGMMSMSRYNLVPAPF